MHAAIEPPAIAHVVVTACVYVCCTFFHCTARAGGLGGQRQAAATRRRGGDGALRRAMGPPASSGERNRRGVRRGSGIRRICGRAAWSGDAAGRSASVTGGLVLCSMFEPAVVC